MYYFGKRKVIGTSPTNFEQYCPFLAEGRWVKDNSLKYAIFQQNLEKFDQKHEKKTNF